MKPDKIREIIRGKLKDIKKLSKKIGADFDKATIHEFRTTVKSLRSFLRLLRMAHEKSKPKMPGKFKRLYHIAGAIRDAQLELDRLIENKITLPVYTSKVNNDISRQKTEWDRHYSEKIFRKMKKRLAGYEYETLSPDALVAFYHTKVEGIAKLNKTRSSSAQIHSIRKYAKDILYTHKLAKQKWKAGYDETKDIHVKQLDKIGTAIGDYNDERLQLEHLHSFSSAKTTAAEIDSIKEICKKDIIKLKTGKKQIFGIVNSFTKKMKASN